MYDGEHPKLIQLFTRYSDSSMKREKLLAIYDGLQDVKGKVDIALSTDQSGSIIIIIVRYKPKFVIFTFSFIHLYQLIAANWTAPRQAKMPLAPSDTGSTSTMLSQSALLRLTKILSSCYQLNQNHCTLVSLCAFAPRLNCTTDHKSVYKVEQSY